MKPVWTVPVSMLLKRRYDGPLSNFAFYFNLRRYNAAAIIGKLEYDLQTARGECEAGAYTRPLLSST